MAKQHRGETVAAAITKSGMKLAKLHAALGISRPTLYRRLEDPNLDFDFIKQVGQLIYHDFGQDFKELAAPVASVVAEPMGTYQVASLDECKDRLLRVYDLYLDKVRQYDDLKVRYDALLNKR
ncbi:MAG: hypothetical protein ACRYFR_06400 [Janthinobacterium lividum]